MNHQILTAQISSAKSVDNFFFSFALSTLWDRLKEPLEVEELIRRFRANIVISAPESFEEEEWVEISIGALHFQVWPFLSCPSHSIWQSIFIPGYKPIFARLWLEYGQCALCSEIYEVCKKNKKKKVICTVISRL